MSKKLKRLNFWVRRKSHLTLIAVGSVVVLLLFFNEDTSMKLNMKYQTEIKDLKQQAGSLLRWIRRFSLYRDGDMPV